MMTISILPETEARLREKAAREGQDVDAVAEALLSMALDSEAQERAEAIDGIRRGLADSDAGRVRSSEQVFAEMRARLAAGK